MVTVVPRSLLTRTWAAYSAAVTVIVAAAGAQARTLVAYSAVMVTVCAMGAVTMRPLGLGAVTVTCRVGEHRELCGGWVMEQAGRRLRRASKMGG